MPKHYMLQSAASRGGYIAREQQEKGQNKVSTIKDLDDSAWAVKNSWGLLTEHQRASIALLGSTSAEHQYMALLRKLLSEGVDTQDRTGTGTLSLFGAQIRHDLSTSFPLLTTKRVFWLGVVEELLWMLRGETNVLSLQSKGVRIWDEWADENGSLGPVYGAQWRSWWVDSSHECIDQVKLLQEGLRGNPDSRRHIVTAWNPSDVPAAALPPCHCFFQMYVRKGKLSCQVYQRSADMFLGVPFNLASYSLLTVLMAASCGLEPGELVWSVGDYHLYNNHLSQVNQQLTREVKPAPQVELLTYRANVWDYQLGDLLLHNYYPHPAIKGDVSV